MESTTKAYELRNRASERERFFITAIYDRQVTGNLEKALQTLTSWAQAYPREATAHALLAGFSSLGSGQFELSIDEGQKAIALDPDFMPAHASRAFACCVLNRAGGRRGPGPFSEPRAQKAAPRTCRLCVTTWRSCAATEREWTAKWRRPRANPGAEDWLSHLESLVAAGSGQLQRGRTISRRAVELAER